MVQRICDAYELDVTALDETMEVRIVKSGLRDIHVCVKSRDDLLQAVQHEEEISRISEELDVVGGTYVLSESAENRTNYSILQ